MSNDFIHSFFRRARIYMIGAQKLNSLGCDRDIIVRLIADQVTLAWVFSRFAVGTYLRAP